MWCMAAAGVCASNQAVSESTPSPTYARSIQRVCQGYGELSVDSDTAWFDAHTPAAVNNALMPYDTTSTEKKHIQCSVCTIKLNSERSYKGCRHYDIVRKGSIESGDNEPEKDFDPDTDIPRLQLKNINGKATTDLASGDRENKVTAQEINVDGKKTCNEEDALISHKELNTKKSNVIFVEYKNPDYQESKSSISTNTAADCSKNTESKEDDVVENCDKDPRPVVCPVTICSKMVTIDSLMLHFLFDHSKVPRTTLDDMVPQEVILKHANFSTEIQCVASFIMEIRKSASQTIRKRRESSISTQNSKKDNKLLLLLAVRLPICSVKLPSFKCVFTRSIHTQTDKINEHCSGICTENLSKTGGDYKRCTSTSVLDENEVFILWLCKLDEVERVFSVTLLGEDKRRGYSYVGDAVHIRDKQDPSLLYDKSECLIVKGSAVNRLFDSKGQITAIVSHIG